MFKDFQTFQRLKQVRRKFCVWTNIGRISLRRFWNNFILCEFYVSKCEFQYYIYLYHKKRLFLFTFYSYFNRITSLIYLRWKHAIFYFSMSLYILWLRFLWENQIKYAHWLNALFSVYVFIVSGFCVNLNYLKDHSFIFINILFQVLKIGYLYV